MEFAAPVALLRAASGARTPEPAGIAAFVGVGWVGLRGPPVRLLATAGGTRSDEVTKGHDHPARRRVTGSPSPTLGFDPASQNCLAPSC